MEKSRKGERRITLGQVAGRYLNAVWPERWWTLAAVVFWAAGLGITIIIPLYYKEFIDILTKSTPGPDSVPSLLHIIVIVVCLNLVMWAFYRLSTVAAIHFESRTIQALRNEAFEYLLDHSYIFFANHFAGALVQKVNRYANAFDSIAEHLLWDFTQVIVRLAGVTVGLWFFSQKLALLMLAGGCAMIIVHIIAAFWKIRYDLRKAAQDTVVTATLADAITNHTTIQSFAQNFFEFRLFHAATLSLRRLTVSSWSVSAIIEALQHGLLIVTELSLLYFGVLYWQAGLITVGTFVLMHTYYVQMADTLWNFGRVIRGIYQNVADGKEMVEILATPHDVVDAPHAKKLAVTHGEVRFDNALFYYHAGRSVLDRINLAIRPGERVGLVGPSGAGKSTLVKLLFRFYDLAGGKITIDGQDISTVTQESLRGQVSLVPQDPILFHRTLMDNIRYGRQGATDAEVIHAAKLAHCHEFIEALPAKYQTFVGERGIKLSGGERQRVAIARAILKNAPILVLDEATSSLDSHSEMLIQDALDVLMKGKTTIVIAHRLSTIRKMDRILVMNEGKILEEGTHEGLIRKRSGLYKKLWSLQAGGFIPDDAPVEEKKEEVI